MTVAALFVKLPYYGERRPPASDYRFLSADIGRTTRAMRQGVARAGVEVLDHLGEQPAEDAEGVDAQGQRARYASALRRKRSGRAFLGFIRSVPLSSSSRPFGA